MFHSAVMLNMLNPLPQKSASFSCHVEAAEYVECSGTYTPPPKQKNNTIKNAILGVGGGVGQTK